MYKVTAVIVLTIVLSSCGSTTYESFRPVQDRNVEIAYVNVVADFSQYRRLLIDDMGLYYPSNSNLSDADIQRVRGAFQDAFSMRSHSRGCAKASALSVATLSVRSSATTTSALAESESRAVENARSWASPPSSDTLVGADALPL